MAKLKEIIGKEAFEKLPKETQEKYSKADLEDVSDEKYIPKSRFEQVNNKAKDYKKQVAEREQQIADLKDEFKDAEGLKEKVEELETANTKQKEDYEKQIKEKDESYALEKAMSSYNFKNESTKQFIMSQIDMDKVKFAAGEVIGLNDQMEALKKANDFCFVEKKKGVPDVQLGGQEGSEEGNNESSKKSFGEELADKRTEEIKASGEVNKFFE